MAPLPSKEALDAFLASALRGKAAYPDGWTGDDALPQIERITYHGIAGLLTNSDAIGDWPADIAERVKSIARAQSMWELRHAEVLRALLERLAGEKVPALLLKGTALAYDLYANPADRARGDTDLLIQERDVQSARGVLAEAGFDAPSSGAFLPVSLRSQENWFLTSGDGSRHCIDLHWRPLNSPALDKLFRVSDWFEDARPLPLLSNKAFAPDRARMLLHACVHRSMHDCSPYQVGDDTHFGGNRLIWLWDIALLGRALTDGDWSRFCRLAADNGVANACRDGLAAAVSRFGPIHPPSVAAALAEGRPSTYLGSGQFGRALLDLLAIPGLRPKWRYIWARALPDGRFIRSKYPKLDATPLPLLYARRFAELLRRRP